MSMYKYSRLLKRAYDHNNINCLIYEAPFFFRKIKIDNKWLAYLDWMVVTPLVINIFFRKYGTIHIADHSKAYLIFLLLHFRKFVTCHDMIAIRSAIDKSDIKLTLFGKLLQKTCLKGLKRAHTVICVSNTTRKEYLNYSHCQNSIVILSSLNEKFENLSYGRKSEHIPLTPYFIHIGSNLKRKNRDGILKSFALSKFCQQGGKLLFAGAKIDPQLKRLASSLSISNSVIDRGEVTNTELNELYSHSVGLIFISHSEGFGWPVIEAQTSGTAVICSNTESLVEIGKTGTIQVSPNEFYSIAKAIDVLAFNEEFRNNLISKGFVNAKRFSFKEMSTQLNNLM